MSAGLYTSANSNFAASASPFDAPLRRDQLMQHQAGHYTQDLLLLKEAEGTKIAMVNKQQVGPAQPPSNPRAAPFQTNHLARIGYDQTSHGPDGLQQTQRYIAPKMVQ